MIVWALLRLSFGDRAEISSYRDFAAALSLEGLSDTALDKRFGAALKPLLGSWIIRKRTADNECTYVATTPDEAVADRYAILRRFDLGLLSVRPASGGEQCRPADLADFCRWQLECGRRGWTADPLRSIADRWGVGHTTLATSRERLTRLGLLEVVQRSGRRYSDLVWLKELFDPHWQVASTPDDSDIGQSTGITPADQLCTENGRWGVRETAGGVSGLPQVSCSESGSPSVPFATAPIWNSLPESLAEDVTDLGGTSVPPFRSPTRGLDDAPPPASRGTNSTPATSTDTSSRLASRILGSHRSLAAAPPWFRAAMHRRLREGLERGLAPEHAARAVARVVDEGEIEQECEVLRRALQQAWADQHAGMCPACNELPGRHAIGCPEAPAESTLGSADADPGRDRRGRHLQSAAESSASRDPLQVLLDQPVKDPAAITDDIGAVAWVCHELAVQVLNADDQHAMLQQLWRHWRRRLPRQGHIVDQAAEHVRYALDQRRVS